MQKQSGWSVQMVQVEQDNMMIKEFEGQEEVQEAIWVNTHISSS